MAAIQDCVFLGIIIHWRILMATPQTDVEFLATQEYKYGFVTDIEQETVRRD